MTYEMDIAGLKRDLPLCKVSDDLYIGEMCIRDRPCLYLLVNFIAVGFQVLIESVLYTFVYGMSGMMDLPVDWLSPLVPVSYTHLCRGPRSSSR